MAASTGILRCLVRAGLGLALLAAVAPAVAQDAAPVDNRAGTVRIYVSLATSAMTRLVLVSIRNRFISTKNAGRPYSN